MIVSRFLANLGTTCNVLSCIKVRRNAHAKVATPGVLVHEGASRGIVPLSKAGQAKICAAPPKPETGFAFGLM